MSSFLAFLRSKDIFGHPIQVNYLGDQTYKTNLGAVCTLVIYTLAVLNIVTLT